MTEIATNEFRSGTLLHGVSLAACALVVLLCVWWMKHHRAASQSGPLQMVVGVGCLIVWLVNTAYWAAPSRFTWNQGLPLHYCNMANLIGAVAVLWHRRLFQALTYFWALALCSWAFLTPTVRYGPFHIEFWLFWIYHLFILLAVTHVMIVDRFRPNIRDLLRVSTATAVYTAVLVTIDYAFRWNYGFVGPGIPKAPTLLDALGSYPLRLVWITLLAAFLFILCLLPWHLRQQRET